MDGRITKNQGTQLLTMSSTLDEVFRALADQERRRLLLAVFEQNASSFDYPDDVFPAHDVGEEVHVRMNHVHLPLLDQAGLIEWDREDEQIAKGPTFDDVRPLFDFLAEKPVTSV